MSYMNTPMRWNLSKGEAALLAFFVAVYGTSLFLWYRGIFGWIDAVVFSNGAAGAVMVTAAYLAARRKEQEAGRR